MSERVLHCWEDGPNEDRGNDLIVGTTCILPAEHAGPHEWTPNDLIRVTFVADSGAGDASQPEGAP